jgi:hypothetical protein
VAPLFWHNVPVEITPTGTLPVPPNLLKILTPEALARALELAWQDGFRTGLVAGVIAGLVAGMIVGALLRSRS